MESVMTNKAENEIMQIEDRDKVHMDFEDISYTLSTFNFNKFRLDKKEVLKGVSGCFKSGELTGIIGPSGAGKTTLLNILAGYSTLGAKGTVRINGQSVSASQSSNRGGTKYIRQQDDMRSHLTLYESMYYAAALKRVDLTAKERHKKVIEILQDLNVYDSKETLIGNLSGGEKRRLAVSLELLSDPSLMFLDEPTTGLDSSASTSLVALLSRLAKSGRTIVATIQQPSAMLLEKFDTILCLANGTMLYNGPRRNIVPALKYADLTCPSHYNPADFLIEIASFEQQSSLDKAAARMLEYNTDSAENNIITLTTKSNYEDAQRDKVWTAQQNANIFQQTIILMRRTFLIAMRSYKYFLVRLFAYLITGFLIGKVYYMAGSDASTLIGNGSAVYSCTLFVIYAALMYITLVSQLELEIVKGEYFNQWYKLGPYMLSFLAVEFPFTAIMTTMCSAICYWLTGNPVEWDRVTIFLFAMLMSSICAQAWGFFLGSTMPITLAIFVGPSVTCIFSIFAFSMPLKFTPYPFRWLYHISYFRATCHIAINAIYGNRNTLPCSKEYCHYTAPKQFLKAYDLSPIDLTSNFSLLIFTTLMLYGLTYGSLYYRLNKR